MGTIFAEQAVKVREVLKDAEQRLKEAEEKWKAWAEKEAQVKAGKAVSAERKKAQAKGKHYQSRR